ncbi:MAG: rhodanese-like domain-containing protein [Rhodobacteraceae bacterium]|nr:rhodanese-like domain-containing protein [Paracoccaceae bacterium]
MPQATPTVSAALLSRRKALAIGAGALVAGTGGYYAWILRRPFDGRTVTPEEALALVRAGQLYLIDIRRPDEWAATGVAEGAIPIDMRRADFTAALSAATAADPARPVALICARGVRSSQLTARLEAAGQTDLVDVPEGMQGSRAGPGWVARGLPVTGYPG